MALPTTNVKVLEHCQISPPRSSVHTTSLPLTFFDIPWLLFPPSQPLFFYDFPHSTLYFTINILPNLKQSLSLTLQHFFPFAGNILLPPEPAKPEILYTDIDSISMVFAESDGDFYSLCANHPKHAQEFHLLVPQLQMQNEDDEQRLPLLAIQITVFPNNGFCIGLAYRHVVTDGRTFDHFLKFWASICRFGLEVSVISKLLPCFDRNLIEEPNSVKDTFFKDWRELKSFQKGQTGRVVAEMVRATFVVSRRDMEKIKQSILCKFKKKNLSETLLLSPYVVTCAFLWVCLTRARGIIRVENEETEPLYFGFIAGGLTRLDYKVPTNYFGNCVAFGRAQATRAQLLGDDGLFIAAKAIGDKIKELNGQVLGRVNEWLLEWKVLLGSELHVTISGSPKVDLYGLDFGWGRPRKIEDISIDCTSAISLIGSREMEGEIEVGLSLPRSQMDFFSSTFTGGLKSLS